VVLTSENGMLVRRNVDKYNFEFISGAMVLMASVTVVSYIMYTVSPAVIQLHRSDKLYLTGFWVILGFLRYLQITFVENKSGSPTMVLLRDYFLQIVILCWMGSFFILLYVVK
jgi:decaprenyl-phosphate phosphoribosyltransferase